MKRRAALALSLALALGCAAPVLGQSPAEPAPDGTITVEEIAQRLSVLDAAEVDDATRTAAVNLYRQAREQLEQAAVWAQRAADYEQKTADAPALLDTIRAELATPPSDPYLGITEETTLAQIEQARIEAEAQLADTRTRAEDLEAEPRRRGERRAALATDIADTRARLTELSDALAAPPAGDEPVPLSQARRALSLAQRAALRGALLAHQNETASYDARTNLLPARRDRAQRRVDEAQKRVDLWQNVALMRRRMEAEAGTREAERLSEETSEQAPAIRSLADENQRWAEMRAGTDGVAAKLEHVTTDLSAAKEQYDTLRDQFRRIRRKVAAAGLTPAMGVLLRKQYESLPEPAALRRDARMRQAEISQAQFRLIEVEEKRGEAGDIERQLRPLLVSIPATMVAEERVEVETVARALLTARRDLLDALLNDYTAYFDRLMELDVTMRALVAAAEEYRTYIEERILWVRSTPLLDETGQRPRRGYDVRGGTADAAAWLFHPAAWQTALGLAFREVGRQWVTTVLMLSVVLVLVIGRRSLHRRLHEVADAVRRPSTDRYFFTTEIAAITLLLAVPLPLFLWVLGWRIGAPAQQTPLGLALSRAVQSMALAYLAIAYVRQALRHSGLAESHFRWPEAPLRLVHRHLRWLTPVALAVIFVVVAIEEHDNEVWKHGLGRVIFMLGMGAVGVFVHRVLRPGTSVQRGLKDFGEGWLARLRQVLYPLGLAVPLGLIVVAGAGYYYTALQLWARIVGTLLLAGGLVLVNALAHRWLFIARRRLVFEKARQRREAALADAETEANQPAGATLPAVAPVLDEAELSIPALNVQTRRLFGNLTALALAVGVLMIWADVLPALRMLDRVQIWPSVHITPPGHEVVADLPAGASGEAGAEPEGAPSPAPLPGVAGLPRTDASGAPAEPGANVITLANVGVGLLVFFATFAAARNLPGLLEIGFLQRLPMDAGSRYAVTTVARYAITIIGVTVGFGAIGISWSSVQWLAAALTFGLAFGLQEIFANFVSGLIILAERPIRLGDTVTVGEVNGTVSRIRMRATTIRDWERKELIVPNKAFITGQLINWSLSDPILRRTVHVGVAYGSDVAKTTETLLRVAKENEVVLDEPSPDAFFLGFGDSALEFELRVFVPHPDYRFLVPHQLHVAIDAAFREEGIVIAFPQQDLHIKSADALEVLFRARSDDPDTPLRPGT